MKKTIIALAAASILALTGCSTDDKPAPAPETEQTQVTPEVEPEEEPVQSMDEIFIEVLAEEEPAFAQEPARGAAIDLAHATCEAFDRGVTFDQASNVIIDAGFEPYLAGFIIGAGTAAYCPEHSDVVEGAAGV